MTNPIIGRQEWKRLPFKRRPVADPGTVLVFQMPSGELATPSYPYTAGDVWWRGPRAVYTVDVRQHTANFECQLPCSGDVSYFDAAVGFTWNVTHADAVVKDLVNDAVSPCRGYLISEMRKTTRRFKPLESAQAEREVLESLAKTPIELANGLRIAGISVELRLDPAQLELAKRIATASLEEELAKADERRKQAVEEMSQKGDLQRRQERIDFYSRQFVGAGGRIASVWLSEDPGKVADAANYMYSLEQQDQELAIKAIRAIVDSDNLRLGELDPVVAAAVERFTRIMSGTDRFTSLAAGPATTPPILQAGENSFGSLEDSAAGDAPEGGDGMHRSDEAQP